MNLRDNSHDVHTWMTMLSMKEDLIIQIFDNQSIVDENVGCVYLYLSEQKAIAVMALDQDNVQ